MLEAPVLAPFKQALPAPSHADGRTNLVGLSREELTALFKSMGEPAFRARPIAQVWAETVGGIPPTEQTYLSLTPARNGTDGFFVAVFEKVLS